MEKEKEGEVWVLREEGRKMEGRNFSGMEGDKEEKSLGMEGGKEERERDHQKLWKGGKES